MLSSLAIGFEPVKVSAAEPAWRISSDCFFCASITGRPLASDGTPLDCTGFGLAAIDHAAPAVIDIRL